MRWKLRPILQETRSLSKDFESVKATLVNRLANSYADFVAKRAKESDEQEVWRRGILSKLRRFLEGDLGIGFTLRVINIDALDFG